MAARGPAIDYLAMSAALAGVTGVLGVAAGLMRLGFLAAFISEPVLKGFIVGLALTIIVGQLPKLFGVPSGGGEFVEELWDLCAHLGDTSAITLVVGAGSLVLVLGLREWLPIVPGSLLAVLVGIAAVAVFDLDDHGVAIVGTMSTPACPRWGFRTCP